jgi:choline dehydrogenase-like flavoprotein
MNEAGVTPGYTDLEAAEQSLHTQSMPILHWPQGDQEHHGLEAESHTAQRLVLLLHSWVFYNSRSRPDIQTASCVAKSLTKDYEAILHRPGTQRMGERPAEAVVQEKVELEKLFLSRRYIFCRPFDWPTPAHHS